MSRRDVICFLGGMLFAAALLLGAWALLGRAPAGEQAGPIQGAPAVADGVSAGTPAQLMPPRKGGANAGSLDDVTQALAQRLAARGGSDADWSLLAQSYDFMGRHDAAAAARRHELLAAGTPQSSALESAPAAAPHSEVAPADLASLAAALDGVRAQGNTPAARVSGTVEIATALAGKARPGAALFIYVKDISGGGAPLAVLRTQTGQWPVSFQLDDSNAMVPGHDLSSARQVQIEARISVTGDALPRPGDLVGTVTGVNPRAGHPVKIAIDREIR